MRAPARRIPAARRSHLRHRKQKHHADGVAQQECQQCIVGLLDHLLHGQAQAARRASGGSGRRKCRWRQRGPGLCPDPAAFQTPPTAKTAPTVVLSPAKVVSRRAQDSSSLSQGSFIAISSAEIGAAAQRPVSRVPGPPGAARRSGARLNQKRGRACVVRAPGGLREPRIDASACGMGTQRLQQAIGKCQGAHSCLGRLDPGFCSPRPRVAPPDAAGLFNPCGRAWGPPGTMAELNQRENDVQMLLASQVGPWCGCCAGHVPTSTRARLQRLAGRGACMASMRATPSPRLHSPAGLRQPGGRTRRSQGGPRTPPRRRRT